MMKKLTLSLIAVLISSQFCLAQWTTTGNNISNSNSGNVGIGTSAPDRTLTVNSSDGVVSDFNSSAANGSLLDVISTYSTPKDAATRFLGSTQWTVGNDSSPGGAGNGNFIIAHANNYPSSINSAQKYFVITTAGNIGIGGNEVAPTHALTFPSSSTGIALYNTSDQTANFERGYLYWSGNTLNLGTTAGGTGVQRNVVIAASTNAKLTVNAYTQLVGSYNFYSGSGTSGNGSIVGINGTLNTSNAYNQFGLSVLPTISQSSTAGFDGLWISPYEQTLGSGSHYLIDAGTNSAPNGAGTHTSKFSVDDKGNGYFAGTTGINTTYIPSGYQLAVNGSVIATAVTVQLKTSWPDYVFRPNYTLLSLNKLKSYIDQNHHLPEMPTETEIYKNGLNVGELDKALVKKVEELTLYLINKDDELRQEQKKNAEQEAQLKTQQKVNEALKAQLNLMQQQINAINERLNNKH